MQRADATEYFRGATTCCVCLMFCWERACRKKTVGFPGGSGPGWRVWGMFSVRVTGTDEGGKSADWSVSRRCLRGFKREGAASSGGSSQMAWTRVGKAMRRGRKRGALDSVCEVDGLGGTSEERGLRPGLRSPHLLPARGIRGVCASRSAPLLDFNSRRGHVTRSGTPGRASNPEGSLRPVGSSRTRGA
jgi:hypothetical protein